MIKPVQSLEFPPIKDGRGSPQKGGRVQSKTIKKWSMPFLTLLLSYSLTHCLYAGEPATITGDRMKILSKGDIMEFIGNVKLVQKNLKITANKMISNEKTGAVSGKGDVVIRYSSGTTTTYAWAKTAEYNKNSGDGVISGDVKVKRVLSDDTTNAVNLTCGELEIFEFGERLHTVNNVRIFQNQVEAQGAEAFYNHKIDEILLLGGTPKIIRKGEKEYIECTGDKIYVGNSKETITITGSVKTRIVIKNKEDLEREEMMKTDEGTDSNG
ncbi:MAG: LPS export ABC transporter periplasmic protein LptC [Elusimicrobia bacterium]|nr:LPS export ABC transporter periplasmic protein LptC [Elusimicrobiota bacterium]